MQSLKARSLKGDYSKTTLAAALPKATHDHYPIAVTPGTPPTIFVPQANVPNNTIDISNAK